MTISLIVIVLLIALIIKYLSSPEEEIREDAYDKAVKVQVNRKRMRNINKK